MLCILYYYHALHNVQCYAQYYSQQQELSNFTYVTAKFFVKHKLPVHQYAMVALKRLEDFGIIDGDLLDRQRSDIGQVS